MRVLILFVISIIISIDSALDTDVEEFENDLGTRNGTSIAADTPMEKLHALIRDALFEIKQNKRLSNDTDPMISGGSKCRWSCVHGTCTDCGYCSCSADWYGDRCDVNPMQNSFHFPSWDPTDLMLRSLQAADRSEDAERLIRKLDSLQHLHACSGSSEDAHPAAAETASAPATCDVQVVVMAGRGLGSWVHHIAGALTWSIAHNRTLVLRFPYDYFFHDGCAASTAPRGGSAAQERQLKSRAAIWERMRQGPPHFPASCSLIYDMMSQNVMWRATTRGEHRLPTKKPIPNSSPGAPAPTTTTTTSDSAPFPRLVV